MNTLRGFLDITESRNNDRSLLEPFKAFKQVKSEEVYTQVESTCGNIRDQIEKITGECFYSSVPAPYMLARLVAAGFTPEVHGQEAYKVTFEFYLQHKKTGKFITFYDYKGASSLGSDVFGESAPEEFVNDAVAIVKALSNSRFPHPYEGCVVGEIA